MEVRDPRPTPDHPAKGSSPRKISLHSFWLGKTSRDLGSKNPPQNSQDSPLKGPTAFLGFKQTLSGLQHWGSNWKGTSGIWEKMEASGIRMSARGQLPPRKNSRGHAAVLSPFGALPTQSHRASTPCQRLHQPGSHRLPCPGDYLRLHCIQPTSVLFYNRPCY